MEKTKFITNWYELIELWSSIDPLKETIVLNGWVTEQQEGGLYVCKLSFTVKPISILRHEK